MLLDGNVHFVCQLKILYKMLKIFEVFWGKMAYSKRLIMFETNYLLITFFIKSFLIFKKANAFILCIATTSICVINIIKYKKKNVNFMHYIITNKMIY